MALIQGTEGSIKSGPSGSEQTVGFITEWEGTLSTEIKSQGPFVGNGVTFKNRGAKGCKGSVKGFTPVGRDPGQTNFVTAHEDGEDLSLVLTSDEGYVLTIPASIITEIKTGQKADEGVPFEASFEDNGGYTYAPVAAE